MSIPVPAPTPPPISPTRLIPDTPSTDMSLTSTRFPVELLTQIVKDLAAGDAQATMATLMRTSQQMYQIASPMLYRRPSLRTEDIDSFYPSPHASRRRPSLSTLLGSDAMAIDTATSIRPPGLEDQTTLWRRVEELEVRGSLPATPGEGGPDRSSSQLNGAGLARLLEGTINAWPVASIAFPALRYIAYTEGDDRGTYELNITIRPIVDTDASLGDTPAPSSPPGLSALGSPASPSIGTCIGSGSRSVGSPAPPEEPSEWDVCVSLEYPHNVGLNPSSLSSISSVQYWLKDIAIEGKINSAALHVPNPETLPEWIGSFRGRRNYVFIHGPQGPLEPGQVEVEGGSEASDSEEEESAQDIELDQIADRHFDIWHDCLTRSEARFVKVFGAFQLASPFTPGDSAFLRTLVLEHLDSLGYGGEDIQSDPDKHIRSTVWFAPEDHLWPPKCICDGEDLSVAATADARPMLARDACHLASTMWELMTMSHQYHQSLFW